MPTIQFICMANSTKHGGRCIAGLRTDGEGWIRPVSELPDGTLKERHYLCKGQEPQIFDLVEADFIGPRPEHHHPENWLIGKSQWRIIKHQCQYEFVDLIADSISIGPDLFGDHENRIAFEDLQDDPAEESLTLLKPKITSWIIKQPHWSDRGHKINRCRVRFNLGGGKNACEYDLPITDPIWCERILGLDVGEYSSEVIGINPRNILLAGSLGEPFLKDRKCPDGESECYKLIVAIVEIDDDYVNLIDYMLEKSEDEKDEEEYEDEEEEYLEEELELNPALFHGNTATLAVKQLIDLTNSEDEKTQEISCKFLEKIEYMLDIYAFEGPSTISTSEDEGFEIKPEETSESQDLDNELYEELRALRNKISSEEGCAAYVVATNACLRDMVRKKPLTKGEILEVHGIGEKRYELYGERFLGVIQDYLDES